jgi:drug/metabolite transporter (DMT)-like permease
VLSRKSTSIDFLAILANSRIGMMKIASPHLRGLAITTAGVLVITPDSLLVRLIETDVWSLLFYRGLFVALALSAFISIRFRREMPSFIRAVGWVGVLAGCFSAVSNILFVLSLTLTTVANTLVIVSAAPLFAAVFSRVVLKEAIAPLTWLAVLVVFIGIVAIFSGSFGRGSLIGGICAIGAAFFFAGHLTSLRYKKGTNMLPAVALGGLFTALAVFPLAAPLSVNSLDLALLAVMGFVMLPIALGLIALGPRLIPAPEVGLLVLVEAILGPYWVWLVINEVPAVQTISGGVLILGTLVVHTAYMLRRETSPC